MDFNLSSEQQMIYDYGGHLAESYDHKYWLEMGSKRAFPREMWQQLAADGFAGLMVDEAHGGGGFTHEYGLFDLYSMARLMRTAPISRELILNYISEHVMGLPRSY